MEMSYSNKKNRSTEEEGGGVPAWMVTFSDLATLLLTFFVLLLSMSSMDDKTLKSLFTNFTSACGILNFKTLGEIYKPKEILIEGIYSRLSDTLVIKRADDPVDTPSESKETFLQELGGKLIIQDTNNGFKMVFGHQLLFTSGNAELKEEMKPILDKIANFINVSFYQIYLDGHTDNVPIRGGKYSSNEDLSLARSLNIMHYLVEEGDVSPDLIAVAGYGDSLPVAPNDTPTGRANNRRAEMIFKNKTYF